MTVRRAPSTDTFSATTAAAMLARDDVLIYLAYVGEEPAQGFSRRQGFEAYNAAMWLRSSAE